MREIKFRGMSKDSGKWLYGRLKDVGEIVDAKTVSQCTGLKDREGREIYEDDILGFRGEKGYVAYCAEKARYVVMFRRGKYEKSLFWVCTVDKPVVIGNVYEDPELLEQERPNA